jgi:general secretion pathway protein J
MRRSRGFTLLEVVVAIALFAMIMSVLYGGFATSVRAYEAAEVRIGAGARLRVVSAFLRRSLNGAFPLALVWRNERKLLFEGEPERVRYVSDLPAYLGFGGLHEIVIERERDGGEVHLVMRRRPLVIGEDGEIEGEFESRVLLEDLGELRFRFFGSDNERESPVWRERWPAGTRMPLLVELVVRDPDDTLWPAIVARPRVDTVRYQGVGIRAAVPAPLEGNAQPGARAVETPSR